MSIDTVKLKSPSMSKAAVKKIEYQSIKRQGLHMKTGEILYEITKGDLNGSWDSRISVRPMYEDYIVGKSGRPELHRSNPYVIIECSAAKVLNGQNIYGSPVDFQKTCAELIERIGLILEVEFPPAERWEVRRVDWAEVYALPFAAIQEYFEGIHTVQFPRRKAMKYGDHAVYFPGVTTTVKLYHKGLEFAKHDSKLLKWFFSMHRTQKHPENEMVEENARWVKRKLEALQRLANNRLRVEVEVHADKLDFDFGHKPKVKEITDEYLKRIHDHEVKRLLKEGKEAMRTVRQSLAVQERLNFEYGETMGNRLHGFWCQMATHGENECKRKYNRATFYRNRKLLVDAGVSWLNTDVQLIRNQGALPADFAPLRTDPRLCTNRIRERPAFLLERNFLKLVA